jgi:hypothetical protein
VTAGDTNTAREEADWTVNPGNHRSNDSREFHQTVVAVAGLIQNSAYSLIRGDTMGVARLIVAKLAHDPEFAPVFLETRPFPSSAAKPVRRKR